MGGRWYGGGREDVEVNLQVAALAGEVKVGQITRARPE